MHHTHSWTQTTSGYEDIYTQHTIPTLIIWSYGDIENISGFEPPQTPTSGYDNSQPSSEDYAKEPPLVPPHFAIVMLNVRKSYTPMMKVTSLSTDYVDDVAVIDDLIAKVREVLVKSVTRIPDGANPVWEG
ncbi:hypothetical protein KIW84_010107 [Lathyrus oleraceus]|uniref:Uncharacterized protein n=1 Tax=Pisum sativum TaxID=3888 RepID=A0A9D4YMI9_PEA|nr:hypothetical protein KIW84_010107 [Pisum sativum]